MAVIFTLRKPLYEWEVLPRNPDGSSNGSQVILAPDVRDWLDDNHVIHDAWTAEEIRPGPHPWSSGIISPPGTKTHRVLLFKLYIEDPSHAMLFKLTWM